MGIANTYIKIDDVSIHPPYLFLCIANTCIKIDEISVKYDFVYNINT